MKDKKWVWKRVLRWLAFVVLCVFATFAFLLFLLTLSPGEKIIKRIAEGKLRNLLGQEVRIGSLETNLFSRFQVRDVQIFQVQSGDTISLLNVGHAKADYRLIDWLWGQLSIQSLNLDNLSLFVNRDSSGSYNLPLLDSNSKPDTSSSQFPLQVQLEKAILSNATIQYLDHSVPMVASLQNLNITAQYQKDETYLYNVQVDTSKVEYQGIPLIGNNIHLVGLWSPQRSRLDSIMVRLPGMEFAGNAEFIQDGMHSSIIGDFNLRGNPGLLLQIVGERFTDKLPPIQGDLGLALHLKGSLDNPQIKVHLELPALDIAQIGIKNGLIQVEGGLDSVRLDKLSLEILDGKISGEGKLSFDSLLPYQLSISVDQVDLAAVWQYLYREVSPYQGKIHGELRAAGPSQNPKDWNISADFNLKQVKYRGKSLPDFSARLTFEQSLANFWFRQENSEVIAKVKLDPEQLEGEFSTKISQLEPLAGLFDVTELTGGLEIQGDLRGKLDSPEIEAEIKVENMTYQNFPIDSLTARALYRNGRAHVNKLSFSGKVDSINTLQPPFHLSNIGGGIAYRGYASGPADSLSGEVIVNLVRPSFGDIRFDDGLLRIMLDNQRINLSSLQLRSDSLLIHATAEFDMPSANGTCEIDFLHVPSGRYNLGDKISDLVRQVDHLPADVRRAGKLTAEFDLLETKRLALKLNGDQLDLERIRNMLSESPDIGGTLKFNIDFSGDLDNPNAEFDFYLHKPRFQLVEIDSMKGHFVFADDQFRFEPLELYDKGHHSWAKGLVELEKRQDGSYFISDHSLLQGEAHGREFDLRLLNLLLAQEMQIAGRGSYDLSWNGTLTDPHPAGTFLLQEGVIQTGENVPAIQQINLNSSIQDSVLSVENLSGVIRETPFQLQGKVTASEWRKFHLQMNLSISDFAAMVGNGTVSQDSLEFNARITQMDLSLLQPFFPDLRELSGSLNTELTLNGSTSDPQLDGHLELRELKFQPAWLNVPFNEGIIKLDFNHNEVKVDSLFMRMDEGSIFVYGSLTHEQGDLTNAGLHTNITNVKINRPKKLILLVKSAQLSYKKQNNYYLLDGDIVLGESRMLINFRPQSILPFAQAVERPKQELPSFLQQTRMDVRLRESENIWVDNNLARLRLHTELGIVGSPVQPNLTGRLAVEEGYVLYIDRKFKIKQGVIDFIDPDRLNPIIDLKTEATVKSYKAMEATPYVITLAISGPLDEVVVDLTSDPPLDKSNIVSLLTLGVTREQLAGKDTEGKDASASGVLLERVQSLSSQKIAGYTSRKVGTFLGLEQLTIEGNLFHFDQSWGPQLLASKKISPRMEITYTTTVGHFNEKSIRLDYWLSKHFSLEGETDQQGRAGMNLKYRLRSK